MTVWSFEDYCAQQQGIDMESLPLSTKVFLQKLALPDIHPFCTDNGLSFPAEGVPEMGRLNHRFEGESYIETLTTMWYMVAPPLLAMGELWLRLFAGILGPCGIVYLFWDETKCLMKQDTTTNGKNSNKMKEKTTTTTTTNSRLMLSLVCIITVASTLVLMTDTLYVLENGPYFGLFLFCTAVFVSLRACFRHNLSGASIAIALLVLLAARLVYDTESDSITFGDKVDEVRISEGLYSDPSNEFVQSVVDNWPEQYRTYTREGGATFWMPTGDSRTGLPFLLNHLPNPDKKRVFVRTDDDEYVALDMAFPATGHNFSNPLYMILHGLNGGSNEEYIRDLTYRRLEEGSTVVVMVARGLMDLPVRGWGNFHGARTSDAHESALALRRTLGPNQVMVGAGFSMGAIVLNNYVASYGSDCALDGAISISGGLDMRYQEHFYRAQRLWQPMLAETLRGEFLLGKWGFRVKEKLSKDEMIRMLRASHVTEIDEYAVVPLNGFRNLQHYYVEMSALGDIPHTPDPENLLESTANGKISSVAIPLCVVHALDDPLVTWRSVANNEGPMHPENLVRSGSGNVMLLLTKGGGHVGWPLGTLPFLEKWRWMSDLAMSFAHAVDEANQIHSKNKRHADDLSEEIMIN